MKAQFLSDFPLERLSKYKRVFIIGSTDVGKTTFVKSLANFFVSSGLPCAIADLDVGQTDIGPVGTIGVSLACKPFSLISELDPQFLYFTGFSSPSEDLLGFLMGIRKTNIFLRNSSCEKIIFDTTGWVSGNQAFNVKLFKIDVFKPDVVILVGEKVWSWKEFIERLGIKVFALSPSKFVVAKDPVKRRINRYRATVAYFEDASTVKIKLSIFKLWGMRFEDVDKRLLGFYDKRLNTVSVGWIQKSEGEDLLVKLKVIVKRKPVFVKFGARVDL